MNEDENKYNEIGDDLQIIDLDEPSSGISFIHALYSIHNSHRDIKIWLKRGFICFFALICFVIFLILPPIHTFWWSKLNGIPLDAITIQTHKREIYAIKQIDGSQLWHKTLDSFPAGKPQIVNNSVYIFSNNQTFYAFKKDTGSLLWQYSYNDGIINQPLVSGQNIYSFSHGFLKAFRADSGLLLWKTPIEGHTVGQIILNNDSIYMTADGKNIFMVKRSDGAIGWHISVAETLTSPLKIDGTTLYYSTNQNLLFARNAESSSLLWKKELPGVIPDRTGQSQLYSSSHIIIYANQSIKSNGQENNILALSDTTGSVVWSNHLDGWPVRAATLSHNTITILSLNGLVVAYDIQSGRSQWHVALGNAYILSMVSDNDTLSVNAVDGACDVLDAQNGLLLFHYHTHFIAASPTIENGKVYVDTGATADPQDAGILSYTAKNGMRLWQYHTFVPLSSPTFSDQKILVNDIQGKTYIFNASNGLLLKVLS